MIPKRSTGEDHKQAVAELEEMVYSEDDVQVSRVSEVVRKIDSGLFDIVVHVGDELYYQGVMDAARLLDVHITREDIQAGIDRENARRERETARWCLEEEAKRISKMFGVSVTIKGEEEGLEISAQVKEAV